MQALISFVVIVAAALFYTAFAYRGGLRHEKTIAAAQVVSHSSSFSTHMHDNTRLSGLPRTMDRSFIASGIQWREDRGTHNRFLHKA